MSVVLGLVFRVSDEASIVQKLSGPAFSSFSEPLNFESERVHIREVYILTEINHPTEVP
jgi:hypothetical protein